MRHNSLPFGQRAKGPTKSPYEGGARTTKDGYEGGARASSASVKHAENLAPPRQPRAFHHAINLCASSLACFARRGSPRPAGPPRVRSLERPHSPPRCWFVPPDSLRVPRSSHLCLEVVWPAAPRPGCREVDITVVGVGQHFRPWAQNGGGEYNPAVPRFDATRFLPLVFSSCSFTQPKGFILPSGLLGAIHPERWASPPLERPQREVQITHLRPSLRLNQRINIRPQ